MPRRKGYRRRKKKKRTYRKKNYVVRSIGGFAPYTDVRLKYVDEVTIDAGVASFASHVFSANGCYDPDVTGTGHQPSNFDVWMTRYNHYTVTGSNCRVTFIPTAGSTVQDQSIIGILKSDSGTKLSSLGGLSDLLEQPYNGFSRKVAGYPPFMNQLTTSSSRFSAPRFFGKSKSAVLGDDRLTGSSGANPTEQAYYEIYSYSINGNNPGSIVCLVELTYYVRFSERSISQVS